MSLKDIQKQVDDWNNQFKVPYWKPHEILARLTEETGELAREINHRWGPKKKKSTEDTREISEESADILFTLCCLANSLDINLDEAFQNVMDKYNGRDNNRFERKQNLTKKHAAIIIKDKNNQILFIKRSLKKKTLPGAWSFPSGTVEEGEDIYKTAIRESNEELGIIIEPEKIIAEKDLPEFSVSLSFVLCHIKDGQPIIKDYDEIDKIDWMKFSDFFNKFSDNEIGHGLIWLRKNQDIWKVYN